MADSSIITYIKENRAAGFSDVDISFELKKSGWSASDVEAAFKEIDRAPAIAASVPRTHRWRDIAIISGIAFVALAGGAYGAWSYYQAPTRALSEVPQVIESVRNFSYKISGNLNLDASLPTGTIGAGALPGNSETEIDIEGVIVIKDDSGINFSSIINTEFGYEDIFVKIAGELRFVDEVFYLNIKDFPFLFSEVSSTSPLQKDKWYSLDEGTLLAVDVGLEQDKAVTTVAEEYGRKTAEIASKFKFFTVESAVRSELADGSKVYKYVVKPIRQDLKDYFTEISKLEGASGARFNDDEYLNALLSGIESASIVISIERGTKFVREIDVQNINFDLDGSKVSGNINVSLYGYNASNIQPPSPVVRFDETLKAELEKNKVQERDARRYSDIALIRTYLELYYDLEGKYPNSLALIPKEVGEIPKDPKSGLDYKYFKTTKGYHLGANLESKDSLYLKMDSDTKSGFNGADTKGCSGEENLYCYDFSQ